MNSAAHPAERCDQLSRDLHDTLARAIVGHESVIDHLLVTLLTRGHALLEGVPGVAKTLLVRSLAYCLDLDFNRVQMTPDLMPSDVIGTNVFDPSQLTFRLRRGPVFTALLLADEINRSPAKTQAALLESMQERQVTIDGATHPLDENFSVFATQNPLEYEGTYPLPEAQLDRFLMKILVGYPGETEEQELLARVHAGFDSLDLASLGLRPVADPAVLEECRVEIAQIHVEEPVLHYVASLIRATREDPQLVVGCSPRAGVMLLRSAKTLAALRGQSFVSPEEIKDIAPAVLRHRVLLRPEADIEGVQAGQVISRLLSSVPVPR